MLDFHQASMQQKSAVGQENFNFFLSFTLIDAYEVTVIYLFLNKIIVCRHFYYTEHALEVASRR